ncbi:hypothetical protein OROGR_024471 [Orobanche gracilis]
MRRFIEKFGGGAIRNHHRTSLARSSARNIFAGDDERSFAVDIPRFPVVTVDSSFGGEASFNSSRTSCTKSEITFPSEQHSVEDSRNRNDFVSVAAEPESCADLIAQSFMKHEQKNSGECSTILRECLEIRVFRLPSVTVRQIWIHWRNSFTDLLSAPSAPQYLSFISEHHSEILECSELDLPDHTLLQFIGFGSQCSFIDDLFSVPSAPQGIFLDTSFSS